MSKKKLPKSPSTHTYDKAARTNLQRFFPENWKFIKPQDMDSGIEYGIDWLVQFTDDEDNVTGPLFGIQSKTTTQKLG